jgi:hypothetical protein
MSSITVALKTQRIIVDPVTQSVSVINSGPMGPPGAGGVAATTYLHTQTVLSTSWLINHNRGFKPNADVFDNTGRKIRPAVIHHTINQMELQFLTPRTGTANLS